MADKDPAFLFYSKDWLEGTAEMLPQEKGVYCDLLAHQHQKGSLPTDLERLRRLTGLDKKDFNLIWGTIKEKFVEVDGRLINIKLSRVMGDRSEKAWTNKIIGTFGSICKKSNANFLDVSKIKKQFNWEDFKDIESERLSERLSEWFNNRLAILANANANIDSSTSITNTKYCTEIFQSSEKMLNLTRVFKDNKIKTEQDNIQRLVGIFATEIDAKEDFKPNMKEFISHFISWAKLNHDKHKPKVRQGLQHG